MLPTKKVKLLFSVLILTACSCGNFRNQIAEIKELDGAIKTQFKCKDTRITLNNGTTLQVSVINSQYDNATDDVKQKVADSIGVFSQKYIHATKVTSGTVLFVKQNNYGLVNTSHGSTYTMHLPQ